MTEHATLRLHADALAGPGLLDFAVNVWQDERPAALREALHAAVEDARYPDDRAARAAVAARHGRAPAEVLLLNGAAEGFWLIAHARRPRVAACVHPSFTEPEAALRAVGADVRTVLREAEDWRFDPADVPAEAEIVVLGNPNNPTGGLTPAADVLSLLAPGRLVVVDEAFMDFVPGETESLAGTPGAGLVVVRSATKLWSLAGIRAGYLLAPAAVVAELEAARQPWSVNALALAALEVCARDADTPRRVAAAVESARAQLRPQLDALPGVRSWPGAANFLLLELPDGRATVAALRAAGVAVRPAASFPGLTDDHVRVTVRPPAEGVRLVAALAEVLGA